MARLTKYPPIRPTDTNFQRTISIGRVFEVRFSFNALPMRYAPFSYRLSPGDKLIISKVGLTINGIPWTIESKSAYCVQVAHYDGDYLVYVENLVYDCCECK